MNPLKIYFSLAIIGLVLSNAAAGTGKAQASTSIHFEGSSTLHGFEGTVNTQPFFALFREDKESGKIWISTKAMLNVSDMTTEHKKRDKNMLKMFEQPRFASITGTLTEVEIPMTGTNTVSLLLKIRDVEKNIDVTLSNWKREDHLATFNMTFPVSLKAFNLKGPSVMGVIRVGDIVHVECSILASFDTLPKGK